ncbi:MAG: 3-oxoacid CoA-transferase subunit B [Halanaerobiaceae bacterium]
MTDIRERITRRIAQELEDGDVVNLGIGMPTMVADYISDEIDITLQTENGFVGVGPRPPEGEEDPDIVNAGGQPVTIKAGGACFDSATSFGIIRGGHLDTTVLGALQVDEKGNLANWMIPGKLVPGMGGAMDLTVGAKQVIIATTHTTKKGDPKILKECDLPLTAAGEVDLIVTELAVIKITDKGLLLLEIAEDSSVEEVKAKTGAKLKVSTELKTFK